METSTSHTNYPSYTNHNGYLMPKGFPVEGFISGLKYNANPDDLFVATVRSTPHRKLILFQSITSCDEI